MDKLCLIVSGGDFAPLPAELGAPDCVIACDRGWQHAERLGLRTDWVVGDFDSAPEPETAARVERHPARKDDTDTMLAARRALELGYTDIAICCAFGGRLDHSLANLQTGAFLVHHGARVRLLGADTEALVFTAGTESIPRREGWSLSLFALAGRCGGVRLRGTRYDGEDLTLEGTFPLGVSNGWSAPRAEVGVERGILLVLLSKIY